MELYYIIPTMYTKNNKYNIPLFIVNIYDSNISYTLRNSIIVANNQYLNYKVYSRFVNYSKHGIRLHYTHNVQ